MEIIGKLKKDDDGTSFLGNLSSVLVSGNALVSLVAFIGAGWLSFIEPEKGSILATLQPYAPAVMSLAGSFWAGLIIGRIARRNLKPVLIGGTVVVVGVGLLTKFGVIGPTADEWVQSSVGWASTQFDSAQRYIAALLPSATAASGGLYLGFRKKHKPHKAA